MTDEKTIKRLVESRHPCYDENLAHWNFLEATYEGGRDWFYENIFKFLKEGDEEYADRLERAYRFNHTKQVVDQVDKYLFKLPVSRKVEDAPDCIKQFWERSTLSGLDIESYAKRASSGTSKFGRIWMVVDSNVAAGEIVTKADEKKAERQVYSYIVRPQDMLDMSYDDMHELLWVLIREYARDDEDPMSSSRKLQERFRLWTRTEWTLFQTEVKGGKKRYVQIEQGKHNLGVVPVIQADHVFTEEMYEAPGLIDDVAYLDRAIANYLSNLDAIIQDQTFSQLAMPAQGVLPGEAGADKLIDMSTKRVFLFNGEEGTQPFYLSPDPKQAQLILSAIQKLIAEVYHSIGMSGERTKDDNGGGIDNASGVAKSYDFERVNSLLAAKAAAMELTERRLVAMVLRYHGIDPDKQDIDAMFSYPQEFDVRSVYDEFEIADKLLKLTAPDEVRKEQMRYVIKKLFPSASDEVLARLESSLSDWPPEPPVEELAPAGGPKNSGKKPNTAAK